MDVPAMSRICHKQTVASATSWRGRSRVEAECHRFDDIFEDRATRVTGTEVEHEFVTSAYNRLLVAWRRSMRSQSLVAAAAVAIAWLLLAERSSAHHSFAAEWDSRNCREFTGTLTRIDWQNPHPYFYVDVKDASGKVENWSFQAYSPVTLRRNGTDRRVFLDNVGKDVWVRGCLAKNHNPNAAAAGTLKFSDGVLRQVGQLQD
jgi:hypothetical protein